MLKKGLALLGLLGLATVANIFLVGDAILAIEPTDNGCFVFKDQPPVCPDKYCQPGTASCSNDGKRCYCKPRILASSNKNSSCEIVFGSKIVFDKNSTIYLYGGLWTQIAEQIPMSSSVATIDGHKAIVFKQISGKVYGSDYINDLVTKLHQDSDLPAITNNTLATLLSSNITSLIDAEMDTISGVGKISNHRYQITQSGKTSSCAHLQYGNQPFFLKYSAITGDPYEQTADNPCSMPSGVLKIFIFGANRDGIFKTKPQIDLTKNCTDKKEDNADSTSGKVIEKLRSFFIKDNLELHLLMGNLIVPQGQSRKIYLLKQDNFLLGETINGTNNKQVIEKIQQKCNDPKICKQQNPPADCIHCNSPLLSSLSGSKKSLNDVLQEGLVSGDQAVCSFIDASLDSISGTTTPLDSRRIWFLGLGDQPENYDAKPAEELELEGQLPKSLVNLCDREGASKKDRLNCKKNALECYVANLAEAEPAYMCDSLTGPLETSRWLICPTSNALSSATDQSNNFLERVFAINSARIFDNPVFWQSWSFFRNASNVLLVVVLLYVIVSQISNFGLSNYNAKKILPRVIVAIVLVNISFFLAQIVVDLSNIAGDGLYKLFSGMASDLRETGVANISVSSIALGVLSGVGIAAILGGLLILFPTLIVLLIGLVFVILMLSLRHGFLIILLLLMPVAIILNAVPNLEKLFSLWLKNFLNIILAYPIIGMLYGMGIYLKYLLYAVAQGDSLIQLIGFAMPVICLLATPAVLLMTTRGIKSLNSFLSQSYSQASNFGTQTARSSLTNQAFGENQKQFMLKMADTRAGQALSRSKFLNKLTAGAGRDVLERNRQRKQSISRLYDDIIDKDLAVLNAFHENQGQLFGASYEKLTDGQRQKYRQLRDLGALNDKTFFETSLFTLASKGGAREEHLQNIIKNAKQARVSDTDINSVLFPASKIAEKAGNPLTSALLAQKISGNENKDLKEMVKAATQKARPSSYRMDDFRPDTEAAKSPNNKTHEANGNSIAYTVVRERLFQDLSGKNRVASLENHFLGAIGEDFYKMQGGIVTMFNDDIIAAVNTYTGENRAFGSAEEALHSVGLIKETRSVR